jgi:hypothetical protein
MTGTDGRDWITFHGLRFPERVSSLERVFPPVAGPGCWLFSPHYDVGPDGMLTGVSDIWGGVGIWHSRGAAETMVSAPVDAMHWLGESVAAWHCLSVPVSHRGAVNWRGHLQNGDAVRAAPVDPGGPLIVLTSPGFVARDAATLPRIKRFVAGVMEVLDPYGGSRQTYAGSRFAGASTDVTASRCRSGNRTRGCSRRLTILARTAPGLTKIRRGSSRTAPRSHGFASSAVGATGMERSPGRIRDAEQRVTPAIEREMKRRAAVSGVSKYCIPIAGRSRPDR